MILDSPTINLLQRSLSKIPQRISITVLYTREWSSHFRLFHELASLSLSPNLILKFQKSDFDGLRIGKNFTFYGTPTGLAFNAILNLIKEKLTPINCDVSGSVDVYIHPSHLNSISQLVWAYHLSRFCKRVHVNVYDVIQYTQTPRIYQDTVRVPYVMVNNKIGFLGPARPEELMNKLRY